MTVENQTTKATCLGNGSANIFSFSPMVIFSPTDIVVTRVAADETETTLTEGAGASNYSVSVSQYPGTGSITYPATGTSYLPAGEKIVVKRKLVIEQQVNLENQGGYFPDTQEQALDKLTMIDLQQQEEIDRSLKFSVSDSTATVLPGARERAGQFLAFDQDGAPMTSSGSGTPTSAYMATVLDDETAAEARDTLGFGPILPLWAGPGYILLLGTGQSNAVGQYVGGDTVPADTACRVWNGTDWAVPALGAAPFNLDGSNNITLQMALELERVTGLPVYFFVVGRGSTSIDNWLPGAPDHDMFADIETAITDGYAAFPGGALPSSTPLHAVAWSQGEQDNSMYGLFEYRNALVQVIERFQAQTWFSSRTQWLATMLSNNESNTDRANVGLRVLANEGGTYNFQVVNSEFEVMGDAQHFSGVGLTNIGKKKAHALLGLSSYTPPRVIDSYMTVTCGTGGDFDDVYAVFDWFTEWGFADNSYVDVTYLSDQTFTESIVLRGETGVYLRHVGSFKAGKTAPPVYADFTGTLATDKATVADFYTVRFIAQGCSPFVLNDYCLRLDTVALVGDGTVSACGIDARSSLARSGGSRIILNNCTIIGFNGASGRGVYAVDGFLGQDGGTTKTVFAHNADNVMMEGGRTEMPGGSFCSWRATNRGYYGLDDNYFDLSSCDIQTNGLYGVEATDNASGTVSSGTISGNTTNDLRLRGNTDIYIEGATYSVANPSAVVYDASGFKHLTNRATFVGVQEVFVPASAITARTCAALANLALTNFAVPYLAFDATTAEFATYVWCPPKKWDAGTISVKLHWTHPAAATNFGVAWRVGASAVSDSDSLDQTPSAGTPAALTDTGGTTSALYQTSYGTVTLSNTPAKADMVLFNIERNATAGSDTLGVDAFLLGATLRYTADRQNDA